MSGAAVAVLVAKARQRIVHHFLEADATTRERAVAFTPRDRRLDRRMFTSMVQFGALQEADTGNYWLDEKRYADFRKERLARVLGILAIAGFAVAGAMAVAG
ncbi:hypothetical protein [Sphingomonas aerophila]|uniref:Uncharacterized protein n=1 Tax=Sphingomonas aerophila TaxID=1344948 RepID=A0A7W9EWQ2_9SPHN|nr:hypothetical protein [Sphingomonas aerophila]MBB5715957.1 hypothetical protein [Sphingomonas aerophila]